MNVHAMHDRDARRADASRRAAVLTCRACAGRPGRRSSSPLHAMQSGAACGALTDLARARVALLVLVDEDLPGGALRRCGRRRRRRRRNRGIGRGDRTRRAEHRADGDRVALLAVGERVRGALARLTGRAVDVVRADLAAEGPVAEERRLGNRAA